MSYEVQFHDAEGITGPFFLCGTHSWNEFCDWVISLPGDKYGHLKDLADKGHVTNTLQLGDDLLRALASMDYPPEQSVKDTAHSLLASMGVGDPGETVEIVD